MMNPSMKEQLQQWKEANSVPASVKPKPKAEKLPQKKQEKLSERELRSLIGMTCGRYDAVKVERIKDKEALQNGTNFFFT